MNPFTLPAGTRALLSGNEAVARGAWEAGVAVAAAYPGTPSTEILETFAHAPDGYAEWSVNEKVALEVALGASVMGSRALCAMKHVGLNVAADTLMTATLTGVVGGLVVAVADDVGLSSSQNEQDSRYWGRFAHLPVIEPADSQEALTFTREAFALSETLGVPVILRLTTRVCHVKTPVTVGTRQPPHPDETRRFRKDPARWVMVPGNAKQRLPWQHQRENEWRALSEKSGLNRLEPGNDRRWGFVVSGPAYYHVKEAFPDAPVLKLGWSHPIPLALCHQLAALCETVVVVEETEPLIEQELRAAGFAVVGKELLPRWGELTPTRLQAALREEAPSPRAAASRRSPVAATVSSHHAEKGSLPAQPITLFPRPSSLCVACPHLGVYYTLSQLRNVVIAGDIGCYTLGAGHPWNALDTCISMGASIPMAIGMDKGRQPEDAKQRIVAVIGDSTFLHMGMTGLVDAVYNRANITVLLLDNRAVGMTGGQDHPGTGRNLRGEEAPRVDFAALVQALGVPAEHVAVVDPYELPTLFKTLRREIAYDGPSVIITNQPCVLTDRFVPRTPYRVEEERCTGCGNCLDVGCPAIHVRERRDAVKPSGKTVELAFVTIDTVACTGCGLCLQPCAPDAIQPATLSHHTVADRDHAQAALSVVEATP